MVALVALALVAHWQTHGPGRTPRVVKERHPKRVMGTSCRLLSVDLVSGRPGAHERALRAAEASLRQLEAKMSSWIASSELSRLNAAAPATPVPLSQDTMRVLRAAKRLHETTRGAFDITCRPLIMLWRAAGKERVLPDRSAIDSARRASDWSALELGSASVTKTRASAKVDLGGIAKGYAIDRAIEAMQKSGVEGGMVDVGGDLRVFGTPPRGTRWVVEVRDPFAISKPALARLSVSAGAVCTSGNYARFVEIGGRRLSHIVDPRSGTPAGEVPSVTTIASSAMEGDAWATALSVLGEAGLYALPDGVEAMLVYGPADKARAVATPGFAAKFAARPSIKLEIIKPRLRDTKGTSSR